MLYKTSQTYSNTIFTGVSARISKARLSHTRIIAGKWRGRKLLVLNSPGLRPTTHRLRETLFNWLSPVIRGARCLDCFAGSGALGLEALSRCASYSILLESKRSIAQQLKKILFLLQGDGQVVNTDAISWLSRTGEPFDLVFLDPPFRHGCLLARAVALLEVRGWLADEAWVYVEAERNTLIKLKVPGNWKLHREKIAGQVRCRLYIRSRTKTSHAS